MKQTIILIGLPGVGKSTTGKHLYSQLPRSQYVDGDDLWRIHPFEVTDINKEMVEHNIKSVYQGFQKNRLLQYFIFSWVVANHELLHKITTWFKDTNPIIVLLECNKGTYIHRLQEDQRDLSILDRYEEMQSNYNEMDVHRVDTTDKSIPDIIKEIQTFIPEC